MHTCRHTAPSQGTIPHLWDISHAPLAVRMLQGDGHGSLGEWDPFGGGSGLLLSPAALTVPLFLIFPDAAGGLYLHPLGSSLACVALCLGVGALTFFLVLSVSSTHDSGWT